MRTNLRNGREGRVWGNRREVALECRVEARLRYAASQQIATRKRLARFLLGFLALLFLALFFLLGLGSVLAENHAHGAAEQREAEHHRHQFLHSVSPLIATSSNRLRLS